MAGRIKKDIDTIIEQRSRGIKGLVYVTKIKLILKGINPDDYDERTPDDPEILKKIRQCAAELGVELNK
jgi:hypothetical protein